MKLVFSEKTTFFRQPKFGSLNEQLHSFGISKATGSRSAVVHPERILINRARLKKETDTKLRSKKKRKKSSIPK